MASGQAPTVAPKVDKGQPLKAGADFPPVFYPAVVEWEGLPAREVVRDPSWRTPRPWLYQGDPLWLNGSRTPMDVARLLDRSRVSACTLHLYNTAWLIRLPGFPPVKLRWEEGCEDLAFLAHLEKALALVLSTRSGLEWLIRMALTGKMTSFYHTHDEDQERHDPTRTCTWTAQTTDGYYESCDSWVFWDPEKDTCFDNSETLEGRPGAAVFLFHEMVHALQVAEGTDAKGPRVKYQTMDEAGPSKFVFGWSSLVFRGDERSATGLPIGSGWETLPGDRDYSKDVPTENSLRYDLHIPRRRTYCDPAIRFVYMEGGHLKTGPPF